MARTSKSKTKCFICGKEYVDTNFYSSNSVFFKGFGKAPYCKHCIEKIFQQYCEKYKEENNINPEKKAIRRICQALDVYYSDKAYESATRRIKEKNINISVLGEYMRQIQLAQYNKKNYDSTVIEEEYETFTMATPGDKNINISGVDSSVINFFGQGFNEDDYKYLKKEYDDWVARHECKTKAQEEVFKRLCFKQLEILKATRKGEDTKDLDATFQKLLETAKLQPKQNSGDTVSDSQTFGTLIDKWENTRPLPEIDEELKDVDKIAWYIDVFFRGHLSKMMGLKNGLSNLYNKFMKKYTVEKPEYDDDENSEVLFDAIFGSQSLDSDNESDKGVV